MRATRHTLCAPRGCRRSDGKIGGSLRQLRLRWRRQCQGTPLIPLSRDAFPPKCIFYASDGASRCHSRPPLHRLGRNDGDDG